MKNYYELLNVRSDAPPRQIRASKNRLAKLLHPDQYHADPEKRALAGALMRSVNEAFAVLINPAKRAAYDRWLRERCDGEFDARPPTTTPHAARAAAPSRPRRPLRGVKATFSWPRPHHLLITLRAWSFSRERVYAAVEQYVEDLREWCASRGRSFEAYRRRGLVQLLVSDFGRPPLRRNGVDWSAPHLGETFDRLESDYVRRLSTGG